MITIETKSCPMCGDTKLLQVTKEEWAKFNSPNRPNIQECFPNLSADDKERLITGTCPDCWNAMFSF